MFPYNCFSQIQIHGLNSFIENGLKIGLIGSGEETSISVSNLKFFKLHPAPFNQFMKQPASYTMPFPPGDLVAHYVPHVSFDTATKNCKFWDFIWELNFQN